MIYLLSVIELTKRLYRPKAKSITKNLSNVQRKLNITMRDTIKMLFHLEEKLSGDGILVLIKESVA